MNFNNAYRFPLLLDRELGVNVFFILSGFLITNHALLRWGALARIDARAFYARRFARIVPCLLALVVVLSALDLAGAGLAAQDPRPLVHEAPG